MAATDKNMTFDVNLLPATTGDHNLGSSNLKWNLYVNQINGSTPTLTDTKVTHTANASTKYYVTGSTSNSTNTGGDTFDTGVYVTTNAGELSAVKHSFNVSGTEKAYLNFNSADSSLDLIFI